MKKLAILYGCMAALVLCIGRVQASDPPRKWHGLDLSHLPGALNTATGTYALNSCNSCTQNVADGYQALYSCTGCFASIGVGYNANYVCTNCMMSVAVGNMALYSGENYSTAVGASAMAASGSPTGYNTAVGAYALFGNPVQTQNGGNVGSYNSVLGAYASYSDSVGNVNVAIGYNALYTNKSGSFNNAGGGYAMYNNTTGSSNVAYGYAALYGNTTGVLNTAIGMEAMTTNTTGTYNTSLGFGANVGSGALTNATAIGANAVVSSSNQVIVGSTAVTSIGGQVKWTAFSDGRYKKNIQQNVPGLIFINKLAPITYTLDVAGIEAKLHPNELAHPTAAAGAGKDAQDDPVMKQALQEKAAIIYTGFVAQDVEKAAQSVNYVFSGVDKPKDVNQSFYGLRYDDFVPPLVKAVQELSAASDSKDSVINALQSKVDSLQTNFQTQINQLRAMLLAQKSASSGASLEQNAPNPFTGSTVIGYNLPAGVSTAQLQITDASGKVLAMIPLSGSGRNSVTANVAGYAAGTYQYSLIVDGKLVGTKQMVSVR